jgi:isoleucyl-tRNA synthetase
MVKFIRLLAPFVPFVTETIYQNLVRSVQSGAYESVHHTAWLKEDETVIDQELLDQMDLARQVSSLGLGARNGAGLKVRQPLNKVLVYVGGKRTLSEELVSIVMDELNVKNFEFVEDASRLVTYRILPDNKLLGPKYGALFPKVRLALALQDPARVAASVSAGLPVPLELEGQSVELAPEEILVSTLPVEGLAVAADKLLTVAVDATVTPELRAEGLAREVVRRVQAMRKNANFNIDDRITTYYQAGDELAGVLQTWGDYIKAETLSTQLVAGLPPDGAHVETHDVDGEELVLGVQKDP